MCCLFYGVFAGGVAQREQPANFRGASARGPPCSRKSPHATRWGDRWAFQLTRGHWLLPWSRFLTIREVFLQPRDTMAETFCSICRSQAKHGVRQACMSQHKRWENSSHHIPHFSATQSFQKSIRRRKHHCCSIASSKGRISWGRELFWNEDLVVASRVVSKLSKIHRLFIQSLQDITT